MLQLLDDGRVTDSKGNVVNFCNCIIIFTSNVGSQSILDVSSDGEGVREVSSFDLNDEEDVSIDCDDIHQHIPPCLSSIQRS